MKRYIEYKVKNNPGRFTGFYVNTDLFWRLYIHHNIEYLRKQRDDYLFNLNNIIAVCVILPDNSIKITSLEIFQSFADWEQLRRITDPK